MYGWEYIVLNVSNRSFFFSNLSDLRVLPFLAEVTVSYKLPGTVWQRWNVLWVGIQPGLQSYIQGYTEKFLHIYCWHTLTF